MNCKKLPVGAWIACCAAVLVLVSLIVYAINIGSEGYFQGASISNLVLFLILAIVCELVAVVLGRLEQKGAVGKVLDLIAGACRIVAPALIALCLINLIAARVEGLGFIYFSNADVAKEVQTPANLSSATGSIAAMVCLGVSMLAAIVAAFANVRKKEA